MLSGLESRWITHLPVRVLQRVGHLGRDLDRFLDPKLRLAVEFLAQRLVGVDQGSLAASQAHGIWGDDGSGTIRLGVLFLLLHLFEVRRAHHASPRATAGLHHPLLPLATG